MSPENTIKICPICREERVINSRVSEDWGILLECERCGRFKIDHVFVKPKYNPPWFDVRHFVSAWVRRENKSGIIPAVGAGAKVEDIYSSDWWSNQFTHMGFPETVNEKLDALLVAYANSIDNIYGRQFSFDYPHYIAEVAARGQEEVDGLNQLLDELGLIDKSCPTIRAKGWLHIDELRRTFIASDSAFIAMWFDSMTMRYRDAAIAAVEYCGYKAVIVDQQEYNDFIMNQVVSSIRQSRFMIADFTSQPEVEKDNKVKNGVRGGVYWEAGMAFGLGRPVIHTCNDDVDSRNRIHFDVHQYNTIFWREEELGIDIRPLDQHIANPNFAERLAIRILATVGKGNRQRDGK